VNRYTVGALVVLLLMVSLVHRASALRAIAADRSLRVALVYTPGGGAAANQIRAAYGETLLEHGIPYDWIPSTDLALFDGKQLSRSYAAIVFPDTLDRRVSEDAVAELTSFAALGGSVAVIGDAGSRTADGSYRPGSLFAAVSGVDAFLYRTLRMQAFGRGEMHFSNIAALSRWDVPNGKTDAGDLSSYGYGSLHYPYAKADVIGTGVRVDAATGPTPLVSVRNIGHGSVAYIGLPLGYLRTHSDAFPMTLLTSYLTRSGNLPYLVAAPDGIGRLIIDIHIDSSNEYLGIPNLRHHGLLRRDVPMEFDVTAGPDLNRAGDGLGFDACGRGKSYLQTIMPFGRIGSHGGWAHNEFAAKVAADDYSPTQIRSLIERNDACLQSVTGVPVLSFAAPVGEHPQPLMTNVLDELGIIGYYYTGDTGSPVERPFFNGKLVSTESWAFPIMPLGTVASIAEMRRAHISPARVERWLDDTAAYASHQHGIYLVYSHSYDLLYENYADAMSRFLDRVETMERGAHLQTTDMVTAATFMDRFVTTTSSFTRKADGVHVHLANPRGLRSIAFAIPSSWLGSTPLPSELRRTGSDGPYTILSVTDDPSALDVTLPGKAST
jgi:hypothetical protein